MSSIKRCPDCGHTDHIENMWPDCPGCKLGANKPTKLGQLIANCRVEMGEEVFAKFKRELASGKIFSPEPTLTRELSAKVQSTVEALGGFYRPRGEDK